MRTTRILMNLMLLLGLVFAAAALGADTLSGTAGVGLAFAFIAGSMKSSKELRDLKAETFEKAQTILTKAKSEKRNMNDDELKLYDEHLADMRAIDKELQSAVEYEQRVAEMAGLAREKQDRNKEAKELKRYSLMRAIRLKTEGRSLDGIEKEMHDEAVNEMRSQDKTIKGLGIPTVVLRALTATGTTSVAGDQGGMTVPTEKYTLLDALRPMLQLAGLGVQTWGGLIGNVDIPKGTAAVATWKGENVTAGETTPSTSQISLSPKRLAAFTKISKQLIHQSSSNIEGWMIKNLMAAIAQAVETAGINGTGQNDQPTGVLNTSGIGSVAGGVDGLAPAWSHIIALEKEVDVDNALTGSLGYLTNAKVKAALKNTKLDAGSGIFVLGPDSKELNGHKAAFSNLVPSNLTKVNGGTTHTDLSAIVFGNWADMIIGQWGAMDMIVDPYTLATEDQIKLVVNSWWDVAIQRAESFAAMKDAIAS